MNIITYIVYIIIASSLIIYVGNACYKNGKVFITHYFSEDINFANSINNVLRIAYAIYLPVSIGLTTFVSQHLFKNSKIFMLDIFNQQTDIAMATNKLFKIGFYLLNIGFALKIIKIYSVTDYKDLVEVLSAKIGGFSIYLGIVMILFIIFFLKGRKASRKNNVAREL